jgi:hypothetical protein
MKGLWLRILWIVPVCCLALAALGAYAATRQAQAEIQILDARLGKGVADREIVDETADFDLNDKVYIWLRVAGAADKSLQIIWEKGDQSFSMELAVGGDPWRTWCYKTAALSGDWTVTVEDPYGNILKKMDFKVK